MSTNLPNLNDILKPGAPLPPDDVMISTALEILNYVPHGQQLADFVSINFIKIKITATPQPLVYLPDPKTVYIGFNRKRPITPTRFILMLVGILREAQQEAAGIMHPPLQAPLEEHKKVSMSKFEDQVWYMCTVAWELNSLEMFKEYRFIEELRNMGYDESLALYLKQENKG